MDDPARILVIGLDGADLDLLRPWMDAGDLPHLASFLDEGTGGFLASTIPPVSAPAWASFFTGRTPGRHGVFGFVSEVPGSGETVLASLDAVRGTKLWDAFGSEGRKVGVLNVPVTWPVPEVNGFFVSGMLTPPGRGYTWPPELEEEIAAVVPGYLLEVERAEFRDPERTERHIGDVAAARARAVLHLMEHREWDLLVAVFTTTDRIQHRFWSGDREEIRRLYVRIDGWVGEMLERAGRDTLAVVVSDHGFADTDRRFYANRWLRREGFLSVRRSDAEGDAYTRRRFNWFLGQPEEARHRPPRRSLLDRILRRPEGLDIDWSRTRAYLYSSDSRGIEVNLEGRQPRGIVPPGEYEALRDELVAKLGGLRFPGTGEAVFSRVAKREDVYEGPYVDRAPDVVLVPTDDRYRVTSKLEEGKILRQHHRPVGYHRRPGIFFAKGPGVRAGVDLPEAGIEDVMPTLLFAANLPIPEGCDGRVLRGIFEEGFLEGREERRSPEAPEGDRESAALTPEEREALRGTLEDLGYL